MEGSQTVPVEQLILTVRGQRVILSSDLAEIYGVETRALNQAVKRNADRFPTDFALRLTRAEATALQRSRSQSVTLKRTSPASGGAPRSKRSASTARCSLPAATWALNGRRRPVRGEDEAPNHAITPADGPGPQARCCH